MPSSSTLPYAAKQLDDTSINSRTQPFTRQLNASSPSQSPKPSNRTTATANSMPPTVKMTPARLLPQPPDSKTTQLLAIASQCHHQLDETNQVTSQPPDSLTTRNKPQNRAPVHRNHCTQQMHPTHTTTRLITRDLSPQTHERERSLTLQFATRIPRFD